MRELKEETGYVGVVREGGEGVVMFNGSFFCFFLSPFFFKKKFSLLSVISIIHAGCCKFLKGRNPRPSFPPYPHNQLNLQPPIPSLHTKPPKPPTDPGFCNTNLRMVTVDVDMTLPENQAPKPHLEENEFIEVFTVPLAELYGACQRLEKEGYAIDARVGTLAEGLEVARKMKLNLG